MTSTCAWFGEHARDLPWRRPGTSPWGVVVSEIMAQQTPVSRVVEPWTMWMDRWPSPAHLAGEPPGAAVAAWGRLGYPRRALRLHAAATRIVEAHGGEVPADLAALESLPGFGRYTAAAVFSFAFGGRAPVLDTNVRRVLARVEDAAEFPPTSASVGEWRRAAEWVGVLEGTPGAPEPALWAVASMELGALVCTARTPACSLCPLQSDCAWLAAGRPAYAGPPRRTQAWYGTDRQCRGVLLDIVRRADAGGLAVDASQLLAGWADADQARRCLEGLAADGLVRVGPDGVRL
ncbi:MAG TPA: A/G-specific adenine glycosylase [Propionibacteriaceae bacterium]|nr:A/G-specific adenine glycosylase [Propionibacteriaceae bacterium]